MIDEKSIPQKSIFKSSEVCEIVGVKPYILRFWETEFVEICPIVSSSGKKLFEKKDILLISIIKDLLFSKKLTLEKAKFEISKIDIEKTLMDEHVESSIEMELSEDQFIKEELKENSCDGNTQEIKCPAQEVNLDAISSELINNPTDVSNQINQDQFCFEEVGEATSVIKADDLIELIPEIPKAPKETNTKLSDDLVKKENLKEQTLREFKPVISEEKLTELNVALETIFEKSNSLKGQYNWI